MPLGAVGINVAALDEAVRALLPRENRSFALPLTGAPTPNVDGSGTEAVADAAAADNPADLDGSDLSLDEEVLHVSRQMLLDTTSTISGRKNAHRYVDSAQPEL